MFKKSLRREQRRDGRLSRGVTECFLSRALWSVVWNACAGEDGDRFEWPTSSGVTVLVVDAVRRLALTAPTRLAGALFLVVGTA